MPGAVDLSRRPAALRPRRLDLFDDEERAAAADASDAPSERVAAALGPAPIGVDELTRVLDLPVRVVRAALLELELAGRIERHGGGLVSLLVS